MAKPLLEYRNVEICYDEDVAVHDVSFCVQSGEIVCVVGESGSGKSTLIKAAMGQLGPAGTVTRGDIRYAGKSVPDLSPRELRQLCGCDLAMVFQDSLSALTPIRHIGDQVYESMAAHRPVTRSECERLATEMFLLLGLDDPQHILASYPFNLSGGMGQRVGIAMALLPKPRVLFADEPTSALDVIAQKQVVELFRLVNKELGTTIVLVTHNMGVARTLAHHVVVLRDGMVEEQGNAQQVLYAPKASYTRRLLDATPTLSSCSKKAD